MLVETRAPRLSAMHWLIQRRSSAEEEDEAPATQPGSSRPSTAMIANLVTLQLPPS